MILFSAKDKRTGRIVFGTGLTEKQTMIFWNEGGKLKQTDIYPESLRVVRNTWDRAETEDEGKDKAATGKEPALEGNELEGNRAAEILALVLEIIKEVKQ